MSEQQPEVSATIEAEKIDTDLSSNLHQEKKQFDRDVFKLLSDTDPDTGLKFDWIDIRDQLINGASPGDVLPLIFDYYMQHNQKMDAWCNYLLACSHFTHQELNGNQNRAARRKLELKVKKLLKARSLNPHQQINQFMYENRNLNL
jgi:hypothetical protein